MTETLILLFHPDPARSRANAALARAAAALPGVTVVEMQRLYPDGAIDAAAEARRLLEARRLVLQFPLQWYSTPPLLQAWQDSVLTRMVYLKPQEEGARLAGRPLLVAATAGNLPQAYTAEGANGFSLAELLRPLQATARRCALAWQDPFLLYDARRLDDAALAEAAGRYAARLAG